MPVPLERWPELIWAQSALWVRRRRQTQNKANVDMYTTNSSPTIESLQDWVWRVLGTSFVVKVLLWWIFLSKFLCAYIDEPACVHTSRFINSGVSNPADNGCNWTIGAAMQFFKDFGKTSPTAPEQMASAFPFPPGWEISKLTIHNRNRDLPRSSSITCLSPQTSWLGFIDTTVDLTLGSDDEREGGGTTRGKWWNQDDELTSNVICEEA